MAGFICRASSGEAAKNNTSVLAFAEIAASIFVSSIFFMLLILKLLSSICIIFSNIFAKSAVLGNLI